LINLTERDRLDIAELGSIYAWAIDQREHDLFHRVFTDDALVTYPRGVGLRGLEQYKRYVREFHAMHDGTQHFIANHWLEPMEDHVRAHSYAILTIKMLDQPGGEIFRGGAKYTDRVVRTDAGWRIAERHAESMWRGDNLDIIEAGHSAVQHLLSQLG
jgi:hypothetical protein